jgi:hypothetical protein
MPTSLYKRITDELERYVDPAVDAYTRERLALLVLGTIESKSSKPSQIAQAIHRLGLSGATAESLERRVRRLENDPEITAALCFHAFARAHLCYGRPQELLLVIDPTTQDDRVVMITVSVWYRGRSLPLVWAVWPANQPLQGAGFWDRVAALLTAVAALLPVGVPVTWLADRAFGTPQFVDLLAPYGWHYVVRVQGQTRCRDRTGRERPIRALVRLRGQRRKLRGAVFTKRGWRAASVVVFWGRRHQAPLCLVSDLGAKWYVIRLYRRRYSIEATFRDYKSHGWGFEANQVLDIAHLERLLVGMALATWFALLAGTYVAQLYLQRTPTPRYTRPWAAKRSLFTLGLDRLRAWLCNLTQAVPTWRLRDWHAPNWSDQLYFHHSRAFVFQPSRSFACPSDC